MGEKKRGEKRKAVLIKQGINSSRISCRVYLLLEREISTLGSFFLFIQIVNHSQLILFLSFSSVHVCNITEIEIANDNADEEVRDIDITAGEATNEFDVIQSTHIPPINAPSQITYLNVQENSTFRKCSAFPFCTANAHECQGWNTPFMCCWHFFHEKWNQGINSNWRDPWHLS